MRKIIYAPMFQVVRVIQALANQTSFTKVNKMKFNYALRFVFLCLAFIGLSATLAHIVKQSAFASITPLKNSASEAHRSQELKQRETYLRRFRRVQNRRERRQIRVRSFTLINPVQRGPIPGFAGMRIQDGATINLSELPTQNINLRANVRRRFVNSVRFFVNGESVNVSNSRPHRMLENNRRQRHLPPQIWNPQPGEYVVRAIPFSERRRRGIRGRPVSFHINVISNPQSEKPPFVPDENAPELAGLDEWEDNMTTFGALHCDPEIIEQLETFEGSVWNYDGLYVYNQIADWTEDQSWEECAGYVKDLYRTYVLESEGNIPGWRVFTDGLYDDFQRTGEEESREAIILLATKSSFSHLFGGESFEVSRETANLLSALITAERVGEPLQENVNNAANFALGHLEQWTDGSADYVHPYRVGITMRALIRYYERTADNRVPPAIQQATNWLWENMWDSETSSFDFVLCRNGFEAELCDDAGLPAPDLNMLIAPAYAWLWHKGLNEEQNLDRADQLFQGSLDGHFLTSGKHFSQSYVYAFDFMQWRLGSQDPL